jgi:hypothetical protein
MELAQPSMTPKNIWLEVEVKVVHQQECSVLDVQLVIVEVVITDLPQLMTQVVQMVLQIQM